MLGEFQPKKTATVLKRVRKAHTLSVDRVMDGEGLDESELVRRLVERLRSTPRQRLGEFLAGLRPLERKLVGALVTSEEELIRVKALDLCRLEPAIARFRALQATINRHCKGDSGRLAATLLVEEPRLRRRLNSVQHALCDGWRTSLRKGLERYWRAVRDRRPTFQASREAGDIVSGGNLETALVHHALFDGSIDDWDFLGREEFMESFDVLSVEQKVRTLIHGHSILDRVAEIRLVKVPKIQALLSLLKRRTDLVERLEEESPATMQWIRALWAAYGLAEFFDRVPDSERFEFWKQYIPLLDAVVGDAENRRLFLDFGGFGVIEFAEVGNASYVYPPDYFQKMLTRNRERNPSNHASLKSKRHSIQRLNHHSAWQLKFRRQLANLLQMYG